MAPAILRPFTALAEHYKANVFARPIVRKGGRYAA
ncbi:hypothetical protein V473_18625 [Sphingobium cupriresistens LL01]|uniref:Uncharacterized protein n=1 Tax=Sphingobium cupriresistens LL01 TaxID=1420583 RepID=A0A0J8AEB6_9SPHN|nr:hypothetical protein V473_18625 [Sphingobium cupriresistens LL01]